VIHLIIPTHVGIIPDGNRRFAKKLMQRPWKGHEWGVKKFEEVLNWCKELGIKIITIYTLSLENLAKRPKKELNFLFNIARKELKEILENKVHYIHENEVKIQFFGKLELLPKDLQEGIEKVKEMTKKYSKFLLNLAIAYGGKQEIIEACKKIGFEIKMGKIKPDLINEEVFRKSLYTNGLPDPDLIIRTGGEKRISNFLIFQSAYSEFKFLDCFWPELTKEDFFNVIKEFGERERRFGR